VSCSPNSHPSTVIHLNLVLLIHLLCLLAAALLVLNPVNEVVNDRRPRRLLRPEFHGLVLERELGEFERLVPHVLVDAFLERRLHELLPPVKPRRAGALPLDGGELGAEEDVPEGDGLLERSLARVWGLGGDEGVLVDALKELFVGGQLALEVLDVGPLLVDGLAAFRLVRNLAM
jgi:hypothetical protein